MAEYNLADCFESAVDTYPDRVCLVVDGGRRTFLEMEHRSNRVANHLLARGIKPGDRVGIYGRNCLEWVEAMWGAFKIRAVPIGINFRYARDDLAYLFQDAELSALIVQQQYTGGVMEVLRSVPALKCLLVIQNGSTQTEIPTVAESYETALAEASPARLFGPRSGDDIYMLYTGGTTGRPKGVVWRQHDQYSAFGPPSQKNYSDASSGSEEALPPTVGCFAPLMHTSGQWVAMGCAFAGGKAVLVSRFEPASGLAVLEREKADTFTLIGDAMAIPLLEVLEESPGTYDLSLVRKIVSGGAMLSGPVRQRILKALPWVELVEVCGSTETGIEGQAVVELGTATMDGTRISPGPFTTILNEDLKAVKPGEIGRLAKSGWLPIEYFRDAKKSGETFVYSDGKRLAIPGDFARLEADGTMTLLGRGSGVINTGGEKVFPEEVEAVLKSHDHVDDVMVVGVADERWGQRVVAIVKPVLSSDVTLDSLRDFARARLANYKLPTELHLRPQLQRHPTGKPDYRWAKDVARGTDKGTSTDIF